MSLLQSFTFEPRLDLWSGELNVPWWAGTLPARFEAPATGPSAEQAVIAAALIAYQGDVRAEMERAVFEHYEDVLAYLDPRDVREPNTPKLGGPQEIWRLLRDFEIFIPPRSKPGLVFEMHLECSWDRDHGLCVLFREWIAVAVAGQMDCGGAD
jgi:hypothetical protein